MFVKEKAKGEVQELDAASRLLLKAADLIETDGWCIGMLRDAKGRLCIRGALIKAAGHMPITFDGRVCLPGFSWGDAVHAPNVHAALLSADERIERHVGLNPAQWNNIQAGTKDAVVSTLRAVAFSS